MNKALVYSVIFFGSAAVQAGIKIWEKREQKRRMDPAQWTAEEIARLSALKHLELERERKLRSVFEKAMSAIVGDPGTPVRS